jgi:hypothetical protein
VDYKWSLPADPEDAKGSTATDDTKGAGSGGLAATGATDKPAEAKAKEKAPEVSLKTTKRVSLKNVGDHLMVHLNRFEFDLETMQQVKLNDRFEFPRVLDMWPYTVYGRSDAVAAPAPAFTPAAASGDAPAPASSAAATADASLHFDRDPANYLYELVGVVIHLGTAIGGHYYSYIRERDPDDLEADGSYAPGTNTESAGNGSGVSSAGLSGAAASGSGSRKKERWFEFNDSWVGSWDATDARFDADCFGGIERFTTGGYTSRTHSAATGQVTTITTPIYHHDRMKTANAFCLFYDRVRPKQPPTKRAAIPRSLRPQPSAGAISPRGVPSSSRNGTSSGVVAQGGLSWSTLTAYIAQLRAAHGAGSDSARLAARAPVPPQILAAIQEENLEFWRLRTIYDIDYFNFVHQVLLAASPPSASTNAPALADKAPPGPPGAAPPPRHELLVPYPWEGPWPRTRDDVSMLQHRKCNPARHY